MKKVSEEKQTSELQEIFTDFDGPSGQGNSIVEFEREAFYQKNIESSQRNIKLFNKSYGDIHYCKKNKNGKVIVPKPEHIKKMNFVKGENLALDFVSKAFQNFVNDWNKLVSKGAIPEQQNIDIVPTKAYENFESKYKDLFSDYSLLYTSYLIANKSIEKINNLDSFLKQLSKAVSVDTKTNPITVSKYIESKNCPDNVSGMVIELPHKDNNFETKRKFIESQLFEIYEQIATKNGFAIDKNNPWKLYFNISSPRSRILIQEFMKDGSKIDKDFYKEFFVETEEYDFHFLKKYILEMYNYVCIASPESVVTEIIQCNGKPKVQKTIVQRVLLENKEKEAIINDVDKKWWRFFIFCKSCEENLNLNQSQFDNVVDQGYEIYSRLDIRTALSYVDETLIGVPIAADRQRNFSY